MLVPWLELEGASERIDAWSAAAGLDLRRLGTTAEADEIKDTAVTQPLVVALTMLGYEQLTKVVAVPADAVVAGHSVGELAAAAIAGVLSAEEAVELAAVRGREMAAACALEPTGMAAVRGADEELILARIAELGLEPANRNGAGQIVAAGPRDALAQLAGGLPDTARVTVLAVAGAFHTRFMAPARDALHVAAKGIVPGDPVRPLLSNADGARVSDGAELLRRLVAQVTAPVRWDACQATMRELGVRATVELPPAGALTGLARRELKGATTLAVKAPQDLAKAAELISADAA